MLRGFDISHHQGKPDWAALKAAHGLTFGFCKAGEGLHTLDPAFAHNWAGMKAAGLIRGAYLFAHPDQDPAASAKFLWDTVAAQGLTHTDLFVVDLESSDGRTEAQVNTWSKAWATAFRALAPAYTPGLYAGNEYISDGAGAGYADVYGWWWYPRYPSKFDNHVTWPDAMDATLPAHDDWGRNPDFWQFSENFPTGLGPVDADVYAGSLDQLTAINA